MNFKRISKQDLEYLEETYATMKACTVEPEQHAQADHLFHYRLAHIEETIQAVLRAKASAGTMRTAAATTEQGKASV